MTETRKPGYRDTLNLPRTEFPMKANLPEREPERLAWWTARGLYAKLREARRGAPVWLLHDGPPYSNGHAHMGTAANHVWKDAVVRQASLLGFDSPFVPGWDNHGMPIEVEVSKQLRAEKVAPDRLVLRRRCREYAREWVGIQRAEFTRLGGWGDWDHPYLTMDHAFEAEILEAFAILADKGFIQRGMRSIHWCPTDRTALAEAEIEYQDDPSPSVHVLFPLRSDPRGVLAGLDGVAALAWTTTPWTLPANLGLMVDPGADYVVARAGGRTVVVAAARLEAVAAVAGWKTPEVARRLKGRELVGLVFEGPWEKDSRVVDGTPFVSMEDGTGLVHTAPGHGKEDFQVGARENLGVLCPVDEAGRFMAGAEPFVGRSVLEVNDDLVRWLTERGRILAASSFTHAYPHCWRCRQPVIFRATDQWFMIIDHAGHRERALALIDGAVRWEPPSSQNRIRDSVRLRPDWCLSRQRAWGVGIPALYCEACETPLLEARVMRRAAEVTREHGSDAWYERTVGEFLPAGFACPACGKPGPFRKETDILDVWFDSGCTHRALQALHPGFREAWTRARREGGRIAYFEGPDQHRGWFNSSLMVSAGLTGEAPYTDVLTHGWVLDSGGRAMHKSVGNVVSPQDIIKRSGADVVRWWAMATDWRTDVRIGDEILQHVADAYRKVRNTFRFLLGNLDDFTPADALAPEQLGPVDRAFTAALDAGLQRMKREYETLQFHRALGVLLELCTVDLSAIYLDAAKDRLYTLAPDDPARRSAQTVLWRALHDLAIAASPVLAFTAEEAWQHHPGLIGEHESIHLARWPERGPGDDAEWARLRELRDAVNAAIEPLRAAKTLAATVEADVTVTLPAVLHARLAPYAGELAGFLMVARATLRVADGARPEGNPFEVAVSRTAWLKCDRCWTYREDAVAAEGGALCGRCARVLERRAAR